LSAKYKHLKQLRVTEAERLLDEYRAKLEEATQSAENYRAQMEPQLECMDFLPRYSAVTLHTML